MNRAGDNRLFSREIFSWCLYDFANSSFSAIIATVIFPVYYVKVIVGNASGLGDLWWGRAISLSMAFVALSSPFLGGIADYGGLRKKFLIGYSVLAVVSVVCMSALVPGMVVTGFLLMVAANIGHEGGMVFYNSYLPVIAERSHQGRVSAWGFGLGYIGSFTALIMALPLVKSENLSLLWPLVAVFIVVFALPAFINLPGDNKTQGAGRPIVEAAIYNATRILGSLRELLRQRELRRFLLSFFMYQDGMNTVTVFCSIFAAATLNFDNAELIYLFMTVQVTAFAGSMIMAKPIDVWGPKRVISISLVLWSAVAIVSYFVTTKAEFFVVATTAGLGLGTVQAASRAFFAGFIPEGRESEYFGVYSMIGKTSAILGPLLFGMTSAYFKSQRPAIVSISVFFVAGLILLSRVKSPQKT
ncbi:MFS transporter [Candidatus Magnetominusculus dajiuhuensis]|uniref:MFS transporter n=1 Tax=Candidatus Magnetominusculus dajiuhuensis TaxID=3137712 RepID=UPI003B4319B0